MLDINLGTIMNNLFTYILAMNEGSDCLTFAEETNRAQTLEEDGVITESSELTAKFINGVTIRKLTELKSSAHFSEVVCEECWISYEVIEQPNTINIKPKKKNFTNKCQEAFWLKIKKVQSDV